MTCHEGEREKDYLTVITDYANGNIRDASLYLAEQHGLLMFSCNKINSD